MPRARSLLSAVAFASLSSSACSVLYDGGRYTGGDDMDASVPPDAFTSIPIDAGNPADTDRLVDAARPVDTNPSVDTNPGPPCASDRDCIPGQFCDASRTCAPCDGDGDGLLHQECARRSAAWAFDCDPDTPADVRTITGINFQRTLRAYRGPTALHAFYVATDGQVHHVKFGDGDPVDAPLDDVTRMTAYDAARVSPDRVALVGYNASGTYRYDLEDDSITSTGSRSFSSLAASGFSDVVPRGPAMLVRADESSAYVGFSASYADEMGIMNDRRIVMDVGGDGSTGSHVAAFYGAAAATDALMFASGPQVVLMPPDTTGGPFLLWTGDVRDFRTNFRPPLFNAGLNTVNQLAVTRLAGTRDETRIVALAAGRTVGGVVGLALGLAECPTDYRDCLVQTGYPPPLVTVDGMTEPTIAALPLSMRSAIFATTQQYEFRIGRLDWCATTDCTAPEVPTSRVPTVRIAAPWMVSTTAAVTLDVRSATDWGILELGLVRASPNQIQAVRVNLCFMPDP